jgi:DNA-binding transcriptional regulator YbjK
MARQLDALIEGLTLHRCLDGEPHSRELTRLAATRLTAVPS